MTTQSLTENPYSWSTEGNLIPSELDDLSNAAIFTASNVSNSIVSEEVDGDTVNVLRVVSDW